MRQLLVCLTALVVLGGCQRVLRVEVQSAPAAESAPAVKTFAVDPQRVDAPVLAAMQTLLEQRTEQYLALQGDKTLKPPYPFSSAAQEPEVLAAVVESIRREMMSRGFVLDEKSPDVVVGVGVLHGYIKYEVAPTVHRGEAFGAGRPVRPDSGRWSSWPTATHAPYTDPYSAAGGHGADTHAVGMVISFTRPGASAANLWNASAVSVGAASTLQRLRDPLIHELLKEFPSPTGLPALRTVPVND